MFYQVLKYLSLALYIWLNSSENITRLFLTVSNWIISNPPTLPPSSQSEVQLTSSASRQLSSLSDLHHDIPNTNLSQALINSPDDVYDGAEVASVLLSPHIRPDISRANKQSAATSQYISAYWWMMIFRCWRHHCHYHILLGPPESTKQNSNILQTISVSIGILWSDFKAAKMNRI